MVLAKGFHTLCQNIVQIFAHTRTAGSNTLLFATRSRERNTAHAIIQQLLQQLSATHLAITNRKEESVTNTLRHVRIIYDMKTVISKKFICFPVNPLATSKKICFYKNVNGVRTLVMDLDCKLDTLTPEFVMFEDVSRFMGDALELDKARFVKSVDSRKSEKFEYYNLKTESAKRLMGIVYGVQDKIAEQHLSQMATVAKIDFDLATKEIMQAYFLRLCFLEVK